MHGSCSNGSSCNYCHLEHAGSVVKLDKRQRHCWDALSEHQQLAILLPYLSARADSKDPARQLAVRLACGSEVL
jgi:hypothetical protein